MHLERWYLNKTGCIVGINGTIFFYGSPDEQCELISSEFIQRTHLLAENIIIVEQIRPEVTFRHLYEDVSLCHGCAYHTNG